MTSFRTLRGANAIARLRGSVAPLRRPNFIATEELLPTALLTLHANVKIRISRLAH